MFAQLTVNIGLSDWIDSSPWSSSILIVIAIAAILWLCTIVSLLCRQDLKDTDKIIWTIVVCTLNFIGMILYWIMAPLQPPQKMRTEQELKDYFNSRSPEKDEKV